MVIANENNDPDEGERRRLLLRVIARSSPSPRSLSGRSTRSWSSRVPRRGP